MFYKTSLLFLFRFTFGASSSSAPCTSHLPPCGHTQPHDSMRLMPPTRQQPPRRQPNGRFQVLVFLPPCTSTSQNAYEFSGRSSLSLSFKDSALDLLFSLKCPCWPSSWICTALITTYTFISSTPLLLIHTALLSPKLYIQDPSGRPLGCSTSTLNSQILKTKQKVAPSFPTNFLLFLAYK